MEIGSEFVDAIVRLADERKPVLAIPGAAARFSLHRRAQGDYKVYEHEEARPVVRETADDVAGFAAMYREHQGPEDDALLVYVDRNQAACLADLERNIWTTLAMPFTPEFDLLSDSDRRGEKSHKEFLEMLRTQLPAPAALVARVQEMKTRLVAESASQNAAGKEYASKSVQREILGAEWIDQWEFSVDVYEGLREELPKAAIKVLVDVDLETQTFGLVPLFGELERAVRDAQRKVIELLAGAIGENKAIIVRGRAMVV
jgi:hypothetical protein